MKNKQKTTARFWALGLVVFLISATSFSACTHPADETTYLSTIDFQNAPMVGIHYVVLSEYSDSIVYRPGNTLLSVQPLAAFDPGLHFGILTGPEILFDLNDQYEGNKYLLWLNQDTDIVAAWNLSRDNTSDNSRWRDPSQWITDSIPVIGGGISDNEIKYYNLFVFDSSDINP